MPRSAVRFLPMALDVEQAMLAFWFEPRHNSTPCPIAARLSIPPPTPHEDRAPSPKHPARPLDQNHFMVGCRRRSLAAARAFRGSSSCRASQPMSRWSRRARRSVLCPRAIGQVREMYWKTKGLPRWLFPSGARLRRPSLLGDHPQHNDSHRSRRLGSTRPGRRQRRSRRFSVSNRCPRGNLRPLCCLRGRPCLRTHGTRWRTWATRRGRHAVTGHRFLPLGRWHVAFRGSMDCGKRRPTRSSLSLGG